MNMNTVSIPAHSSAFSALLSAPNREGNSFICFTDSNTHTLSLESACGEETPRRISNEALTCCISQILRACGIPASLSGYQFIREAIFLMCHNSGYRTSITKTLYPDVAAVFHTTASRVERSIRHAIEVGWLRGNADILEHYFGYTTNPHSGKPTNGEFIATICDHLYLTYALGDAAGNG